MSVGFASGAIGGADTGRHALARLDAHRERRSEPSGAVTGRAHHRQFEPLHLFGAERHADEPATVDGHEVYRLGRHAFGGETQVPLVLAIFVVHQDDEFSRADVVDGRLNATQVLGRDVEDARRLRCHVAPSSRRAT